MSRLTAEGHRIDWQGYRVDVPRAEQCRRRLSGRRVYCEREKGHTGNHKCQHNQWGGK